MDRATTKARPDRSAERAAYLAQFFSEQGLDGVEIAQSVRALNANSLEILFVSSIVQGLGGSTSDVDVLATASDGDASQFMTHHVHVNGRRVGIGWYSASQVETALREMAGVARGATLPSALRYMAGSRAGTVPNKHLERIVNGVSADGRMPFYEDFLEPLSVVWRARAFDEFRQAVICALLSARAGEKRAPAGYLLHAVLQLMDALMSHHGNICSYTKWFALRWQRFMASRAAQESAELSAWIDGIWRDARNFNLSVHDPVVRKELMRLFHFVSEEFGYAQDTAPAVPAFALSGPHGRLAGNAVLWVADAKAHAVLTDEGLEARQDAVLLDDIASLDPRRARSILLALRADRLSVSLDAG